MEISYKSEKLKKTLTDNREIVKSFGERARKIRLRLMQSKAAKTLAEIKTLPAVHCHALKGNRTGQVAINISENWRLIFEPDHSSLRTLEDGNSDWTKITKITILEISDYH